MHLLFKEEQQSIEINFAQMYLDHGQSEIEPIKLIIAKSLHEAFKLIKDDEDTTDLRRCFLNFILDTNKEILCIMNANLDLMIHKWGNKHTLENFKGRTPYCDSEGEITPKSRSSSNNGNNDFTSAVNSSKKKKGTATATYSSYNIEEDATPKLKQIYTVPAYESELCFSDLLQRLLVFINRLREYKGLWREHVKLIRNLNSVIHLFYMPEIHTQVVPMLVEWVVSGNRETQEAACQCLAKILLHQHHSPSKTELLGLVKT